MDAKLKIVGVVDGDPFHHLTWSGSSPFFFNALKNHGCLKAAISGLPHPLINYFYKFMSFNASLSKWKFNYHLNTRHYKAMNKKAEKELSKIENDYNHILQINVWFDVPKLVKSSRTSTSTYVGGNLSTLLKSPFGYPDVSQKTIAKAWEYEKNVYQKLDFIFTRSEWSRQSFIEDFNIPPGKVHAIGSGVNMNKIPTIDGKDFSKNNILFVGVNFKRKGGNFLLEAFKKVRSEIRDAKLTVIGPRLPKKIDGVECLGFIHTNTPQGKKKLSEAYQKASIFVMPSLYEPFGVVFLEAMAHGLPCIGTDNCAMPEIIDHGKTGYLVTAASSNTLANTIISVLKNKTMLEQMGKNGYRKFINEYSWDNVVRKIIKTVNPTKKIR